MRQDKIKVKGKHKKLITIIVCVVAVLAIIGIGVGVGVHYYKITKDESYDRFADFSDLKINSDVLDDIIEEDNYSDIFVFVYDDDPFKALNPYTDKDSIKKIDTDNQTTLANEVENFNKRLKELQAEGKCEGVAFYLVNTSLTSNSGILSNSSYGNFTSGPAFIYVHGDAYSQTTKDDNKTEISGSGVKSCITYIKEAKAYLDVIENI